MRRTLQRRLLRLAEGGGEPPDCSKIQAGGPPSPRADAHLPPEMTGTLGETLQGETLQEQRIGAANVRVEPVSIFSELVNNAAEHGMTPEGAHAPVAPCPTGAAPPSTR